jgi:hypothetical protein
MHFVFRFGYETQKQSASNTRHGWDDESSEWVVIDALDEATAMAWGCEIAKQFVKDVIGGNWQIGDFDFWLEPLSNCPWAVGREIMAIGQMPKFGSWT